MSITLSYSPDYLNWTGSAASPQRAHLAFEHIVARAAEDKVAVNVIEPTERTSWKSEATVAAKEIHDERYVERVLRGKEPGHEGAAQGETALAMFEGTRILVETIEDDEFSPGVYFNPQGAKHHAQYDHASGFCVFNDMAWAAHHFTAKGLKVAYLDWDAHHGDGVENLTRTNPNVLTASIHQYGSIFPGTGGNSDPGNHVYNWPLMAGADDEDLRYCVDEALDLIEKFNPDILLMAIGADGHAQDPLSNLLFTVEGFESAAQKVGQYAAQAGIPVLVGGAGGYTPFTYTPVVWAEVIRTLNREISQSARGLDATAAWEDETHAWSEDDMVTVYRADARGESTIYRAESKGD